MLHAQPAFSQLMLADTPNAVAWACRHVVDVLQQWRLSPDVVEAARLVTTELVTNAVGSRPACWPVGTITVSLSLAGSTLVVSVCEPIRQVVVEPVGRGSLLAAVMSHRWGYYRPTPTQVVWAELLLAGPSGAPAAKASPAAGVVTEPLLLGRVLVGLRQL